MTRGFFAALRMTNNGNGGLTMRRAVQSPGGGEARVLKERALGAPARRIGIA